MPNLGLDPHRPFIQRLLILRDQLSFELCDPIVGGGVLHAPSHRRFYRELLPVEKVNMIVDLFPTECESCWQPLPRVLDASAKRYQQTKVPPIEPYT